MKKLITVMFLLCTTLILYAQDETKIESKNGYKIGIGYGESESHYDYNSTILALDITLTDKNNWQITGFGEKYMKPSGASGKNSHYGFAYGKKYNIFKWLEFNYGIGLGFLSRSITEHHSRKIGTTTFLFWEIDDYEYWTTIEKSYGVSLHKKLGLDIKIIDNISVGIFSRTTFSESIFSTWNASVGFHF